jgi:hypothetical protein
MLTIKECRKIIDPKNKKYTDEELKLILGFQTELATIIVNGLKRKKHEKKSSVDEPRIK